MVASQGFKVHVLFCYKYIYLSISAEITQSNRAVSGEAHSLEFIQLNRQSWVVSDLLAGPDGSFIPVVAQNSEVLGSNPDRVGCLTSGLCIYSAPKLFKGMECAELSVVGLLCTIKNP